MQIGWLAGFALLSIGKTPEPVRRKTDPRKLEWHFECFFSIRISLHYFIKLRVFLHGYLLWQFLIFSSACLCFDFKAKVFKVHLPLTQLKLICRFICIPFSQTAIIPSCILALSRWTTAGNKCGFLCVCLWVASDWSVSPPDSSQQWWRKTNWSSLHERYAVVCRQVERGEWR